VDCSQTSGNHYHSISLSFDYFFWSSGLVVPVLRNVENFSFADIELGIAALAKKAREGQVCTINPNQKMKRIFSTQTITIQYTMTTRNKPACNE
jgi:pyruvate/2-oxoglutarate dehydrogenase complex dihydrolipoamide acyltransferase (E2) component